MHDSFSCIESFSVWTQNYSLHGIIDSRNHACLLPTLPSGGTQYIFTQERPFNSCQFQQSFNKPGRPYIFQHIFPLQHYRAIFFRDILIRLTNVVHIAIHTVTFAASLLLRSPVQTCQCQIREQKAQAKMKFISWYCQVSLHTGTGRI